MASNFYTCFECPKNVYHHRVSTFISFHFSFNQRSINFKQLTAYDNKCKLYPKKIINTKSPCTVRKQHSFIFFFFFEFKISKLERACEISCRLIYKPNSMKWIGILGLARNCDSVVRKTIGLYSNLHDNELKCKKKKRINTREPAPTVPHTINFHLHRSYLTVFVASAMFIS